MLRPAEILVLVLVMTVLVWLDLPKLLAPAFVLTAILCSAYRWRRGLHPWPPRDPSARHHPASFTALSLTAAGLVLVVAGAAGYNTSRHERFVEGTPWRDSAIWWEMLAGVALLAASTYWWRRAFRP